MHYLRQRVIVLLAEQDFLASRGPVLRLPLTSSNLTFLFIAQDVTTQGFETLQHVM